MKIQENSIKETRMTFVVSIVIRAMKASVRPYIVGGLFLLTLK